MACSTSPVDSPSSPSPVTPSSPHPAVPNATANMNPIDASIRFIAIPPWAFLPQGELTAALRVFLEVSAQPGEIGRVAAGAPDQRSRSPAAPKARTGSWAAALPEYSRASIDQIIASRSLPSESRTRSRKVPSCE